MKSAISRSITIFIVCFIFGCTPENISPYQRKWKAKTVKENGLVVYQEGQANNQYPGYKNFLIDLSDTEIVILTEYTGLPMTGKWSLIENTSSNSILRLSSLLPQPEGTGGTVEYIIKKAPSNEFILENAKANPKTGNSINEYTLVPAQ